MYKFIIYTHKTLPWWSGCILGRVTEASALLRRALMRFLRNTRVSTNSKRMKNTMDNKVYSMDCVVNELVVWDVEVILGAICKMDFMEWWYTFKSSVTVTNLEHILVAGQPVCYDFYRQTTSMSSSYGIFFFFFFEFALRLITNILCMYEYK